MPNTNGPTKDKPRSRRHHLVPRFYLQRWADQEGRILLADVRSGNAFVTALKNAGVERDFYTVETDEGTSDIVEREMAKIEGLAAEVFQAIDEGVWPLPKRLREILANFLSLQLCRGPHLRQALQSSTEWAIKTSNRMILEYPEFLQKAARDVYGPNLTAEKVDELRAALSEDYEVKVHTNTSVTTFFEAAADFVQPIWDMTWLLLDSPGKEFYTADVPMAHWRWESDNSQMPMGLFTSESTTFPIDRRRCLRLRWEEDPPEGCRYTIADDAVPIINGGTALHAFRALFAHPSQLKAGEPRRTQN